MEIYYETMSKPRSFAGSGLENIDSASVVSEAQAFLDLFRIGNYDLKDYDKILNEFIRDTSMDGEPRRNQHARVNALNDLMHLGLEMVSVHVFGSRVTGYHTEGSDIDVHVTVRDTPELRAVLKRFREATLNDNAWPTNTSTLTFITRSWIESMRFVHEMRHWYPVGFDRPPGRIVDERGNEIRMDVWIAPSGPTKHQMNLGSLKIWEVP
jgi:predicted nucleotidyltransferase